MILSFENINDLQLYVLEHLKESGEIIVTRGKKTLELTSIYLRLNNIKKRCTTLIARKWNFPFALGELSWHLSGSNELNFIQYYSKEWKNISEDYRFIYGSCYGHKIFNSKNGESQWDKLIKLLKKDIFTRRAVLDLYNSKYVLGDEIKDIACSCSIQFLFRNGRLDSTVYMRSNDIIWGLPNDVFFFTMLQELLAKELKIEVGVYNHLVGSLHIYEKHFDLANKILDKRDYINFQMPELNNTDELFHFLELEQQIRLGYLSSIQELEKKRINNYWKNLLQILMIYRKRKLKENISLEFASKNPYFFLMDNFNLKFITNS
jgi:thymidylate synthase